MRRGALCPAAALGPWASFCPCGQAASAPQHFLTWTPQVCHLRRAAPGFTYAHCPHPLAAGTAPAAASTCLAAGHLTVLGDWHQDLLHPAQSPAMRPSERDRVQGCWVRASGQHSLVHRCRPAPPRPAQAQGPSAGKGHVPLPGESCLWRPQEVCVGARATEGQALLTPVAPPLTPGQRLGCVVSHAPSNWDCVCVRV